LWDRAAKTRKVELGFTSVPHPVTVTNENLVTPSVVEREMRRDEPSSFHIILLMRRDERFRKVRSLAGAC
jgi:hypothetical protein